MPKFLGSRSFLYFFFLTAKLWTRIEWYTTKSQKKTYFRGKKHNKQVIWNFSVWIVNISTFIRTVFLVSLWLYLDSATYYTGKTKQFQEKSKWPHFHGTDSSDFVLNIFLVTPTLQILLRRTECCIYTENLHFILPGQRIHQTVWQLFFHTSNYTHHKKLKTILHSFQIFSDWHGLKKKKKENKDYMLQAQYAVLFLHSQYFSLFFLFTPLFHPLYLTHYEGHTLCFAT